MANNYSKARSAAIKVNITPELYEKLRILGERQGQTAGTLASFAVGQFVSQQWGPVEMQQRVEAETVALLKALPAQLELMIEGGKS